MARSLFSNTTPLPEALRASDLSRKGRGEAPDGTACISPLPLRERSRVSAGEGKFNSNFPYKKRQSGFTLIEVLVAVLVLSIALVAITRSLSVGIRDTQRIQDKNIAHWVAMNVLAKAQLNLILIPEGGGAMQTGQESMLNQSWTWKMQTQNISDLGVRQITVQIFDSKQRSLESLQTYVPLPPASPYGMNIYARQ